MHLIVHQVIQFHHIHIANGNRSVERVPGPAVIQDTLPILVQPGQFKHVLDFPFAGPVKYRGRNRYAIPEIRRKLQGFSIGEQA